MVTPKILTAKFGDPAANVMEFERRWMKVWDVPTGLELLNGAIPKKVYCHIYFAPILEEWWWDLAQNNLLSEIKTWDGCWNVRRMRGLKSLSIHSWGCAIDINAAHNPLGLTKKQCFSKGLKPFTDKFIEVSRKYVDCGADWTTRPDGMHFQIKQIDIV